MSANTATPIQPDNTEQQATQIATVNTLSSRTATLFNWLFVIVVIIAIPLAYYFGYIGVTWLNRIGIILNFCAGFMLAPELLGVNRIRKLENRIKSFLNSFYSYSHNKSYTTIIEKPHFHGISCLMAVSINKKGNSYKEYHIVDWRITISTVIISLLILLTYFLRNQYYFILLLLIFFIIIRSLIKTILGFKSDIGILMILPYSVALLFKNILKYVSSLTILLLNYLIYFILPILPLLIIVLFIFLPLSIFIFILDNFYSRRELRSIMIWWGIIFFIVGNLLQFLATF